MKPACIWFNKHLSNTWEVIALLNEGRRDGEFRIVCTHPRSSYARRLCCDHFEKEPIGLSDADYVAFALEFARRHGVDLFFPGRKILPLVRATADFAALGVRVVAAADAPTLALLTSKASVYAAAKDLDLRLPDFEMVRDLAGFDRAWSRLHARHDVVCYKPDVSVFGLGFHILARAGAASVSWPLIRLEEARRRLDREPLRPLMVMQYLPGPERSVDCLARAGKLVRCVVRRKMDGGQVIEEHGEIESAVRRLTALFRLDNLFNVQFRDAGGRPFLLEINARMSGGIPFACQSGLVLPLWAVRLALGTADPADLPWPRPGVWVPQPEPTVSL